MSAYFNHPYLFCCLGKKFYFRGCGWPSISTKGWSVARKRWIEIMDEVFSTFMCKDFLSYEDNEKNAVWCQNLINQSLNTTILLGRILSSTRWQSINGWKAKLRVHGRQKRCECPRKLAETFLRPVKVKRTVPSYPRLCCPLQVPLRRKDLPKRPTSEKVKANRAVHL